MNKNCIILKFGGAAVATPQHFNRIAEIVIIRKKMYKQVVIVVSAMGDTTNQLIRLAHAVNPKPPRREYDMLVSVGERVSISLLAMALAGRGYEATSFTGSQSGIITCDRHSDAQIVDVRPKRLLEVLNQNQIVIVAGFQGVSLKGEITTLGRGGGDTTGVALGVALSADKVEFFKDVPGVFSDDPKKIFDAELFAHLSYEAMLSVLKQGAKVLHERSVLMAMKNGMPLHVRSFYDFDPCQNQGTIISNQTCERSANSYYEHVL